MQNTFNLLLLKYTLPIILIGLFSCDKAFLDSGSEVSREIIISEPFTALRFNNIFDVTLVQDTVNKVIFTCGENLQPYVSAVIKDNMLVLNHTEKNNWSRKYKHIQVEIHVVAIPSIHIYSPISLKTIGVLKGSSFWLCDFGKFSDVNVTVDVKACSVFMTSDNFGLFKINGKADKTELWGWGSAVVRTDSLIAQSCHVKHRGFSDIYVNVVNQLNVSLEFTGNIVCVSKPQTIVIEKKTSSGSLIIKE